MFSQLRKNGLRCAVALGLGLSAAVPAQPVMGRADPILPIQQDQNEDLGDSIQAPVVEGDSAVAPVYEAVGQGEASYYGAELRGHRTASGERFDPSDLTAAHRSLPIGSKVRVTNLANGMSVIVRVNDRGPWSHGRVLDMSLAAAKKIAMVRTGKAQVKLELVRYS